MTVIELFNRFKCTKEEREKLLDFLQNIRITRVINEIQIIKQSYGNKNI